MRWCNGTGEDNPESRSTCEVSAIISTNAAVAAVLGKILLGEKLSKVQVFAVTCSVIGAVLVAFFASASRSSSVIGVSLSVLAGVCKASLFVCSRKLKSVSTSCVALGVSVAGSALCFAQHFIKGETYGALTRQPVQVVGLVAAGFALSLFLVIFTVAGSKQSPAAVSASAFTCAYMLASYAADIVLFKMVPKLLTMAGIIVLLLGVFVLSWAQAKQGREALKEATPESKITEIETGERGENHSSSASTASDGDAEELSLSSEPTSVGSERQLGAGDQALANYITSKCSGTRFVDVDGSRWGHLVVPKTSQFGESGSTPLRIVLFTSSDPGKVMVEAVKAYACKFPGSMELVGVVTDHAVDAEAKICLKRRFWKSAKQPLRLLQESVLVESVISAGVEIYTGEIKVEGFREILRRWNPDVIISAIFGQVVDSQIINTTSRNLQFPSLRFAERLLSGYLALR